MKFIRRFSPLMQTLCCLLLTVEASTQRVTAISKGVTKTAAANSLEQLSSSLQSVAREVEPSVVRILNSAFAIEPDGDRAAGGVAGPQRSSGSGVLISSDGYIVTNAHVVEGARRLRVRLDGAVPNLTSHVLNATLIGLDRETDLAVIKIDLTGLPFLKFGDSSNLKQGQIVLAVGSPLGLENSVSMGVVSAVDRQLNPDDPLVFVQTDAAINPGNSGGPLVDTSGAVIGINTFILSQSGGNEGVGFAIPSDLVNAICRQIRTEHHVHHHQVGILVRGITPALAEALALPKEEGVLIEDIVPQSTAEEAGLKVGDIITSVHAKPILNVRQLALNMYSYQVGDKAQMSVLRGRQTISFEVPVVERAGDPQRFEDLVSEQDNSFSRLGILGITVDEKIAALLAPTRMGGGVLVAARTRVGRPHFGDELIAGDIIHQVNGKYIKDAESLRASLDLVSADSSLVIQVERSGTLKFVVFDSD